jgi:restriction system protein
MDIVYHYPPELFQLLVETIPRLCRSKDDLLLFFEGAGVDQNVLSDLWQGVRQNRSSVNKYDMTRTILKRLNEKGEVSLQERREILKRVTEFEAFSTCWANDQLAAKGLVAEVRHVINVKDSFTRMKQEREREKKRHQQARRKRTEALRKRQSELSSIRQELFSLFGMSDSRKRGKLLEGILNRLFEVNDISVSKAFEIVGDEGEGIVTQIDGMVEIDGTLYLVEMKWWSDPIGKAEISPHLVNVFAREGAGGIFISASKYTQPAITTCKYALRDKVIVLCELEEIVLLLEQQGSLMDFFKKKIEAAIGAKQPLFYPLKAHSG